MRVILVGEGQLAYFLSRQFVGKGYHLTIITPDEVEALLFSRKLKATVLVGDGSDPLLLQDAGAYRTDVVLALTPYDQDNLVACQIAQNFYGAPRTIALVNDPDNREVFQKLGVTIAFSATEILGSLIEQQADYQDVKTLIPIVEGDVTVSELMLQDDSPAVDQTLQSLNLTGGVIACIVRSGQVLTPNSWSRLRSGDRLILISQRDQCGSVQRTLLGEDA